MAERAAKQLELNKSELPNSITEVIATLTRAGFDAYIVGGGVRDTLLGLRPKDFDAVTDAKPHEVKDVFGKRCRIIGRRFQLAHVYSGRDLIEVATFRGPPNSDANTNQDGMIIRDNVWGDIKQDFARRDFSINALYYQPLKGVVHDYCGALDDIDNKIIRLLGDAPVRIEEDPVRLLRALRFKAKLGFEFDKELANQFHDNNWALLEQISPHRLYDETQKMFTGGYLAPLLPLLFESGAIDHLIVYPPAEPSALVQQVAINTDKRIGAGKSINPAFFYAALLWENYLHQLEKAKKRNMPFADAQLHAASKVIDRQRIKTAIPKFAEQFIRDIWILQPKLAAPRSKQIEQLAEHPRFRAGFDFLLLREQCGDAEHPLSESTNEMGDWWQTYQTLSVKEQQQAIDEFDESVRRGSHKRSRGRNRQKSAENMNNESMNQIENDGQTNANNKANNNAPKPRDREQPIVNDASNIPARRRRAADKSVVSEPQSKPPSAAKSRNGRNGQSSNKRTPQAKHDSNELAQLQQLSLNNDSATMGNRHSIQPAPLFVIEHENVVPPLRKQLSDNARNDSSDHKTPRSESRPSAKKKTEPTPNKASTPSQAKSIAKEPQATVKHGDTSLNDTTLSDPKRSQEVPSSAKESSKRNVAQTPQLVSTNNEPIPYKRRRRQPSSAPDVVVSNADDVNRSAPAPKSVVAEPTGSTDSKPNATSAKRVSNRQAAPKTTAAKADNSHKIATAAEAQVDAKKASKPSKARDKKIASQGDGATNKGPVPSKRRRRQPSTDIAVTELADAKAKH